MAVPGLFVLGFGTLLYGLVPRVAPPLLYTLVLWSFLVEIVGTGITDNHWVLDTSLSAHLGPVPASPFSIVPVVWLVGLGAVAAAAGAGAFQRRDLS